MQWRLWVLDSELYTLRQNRIKQEKMAKDSAKPIKDAEQLDAFAAGDVTWLDELATLSAKLPPPEEAVVSDVSAQITPKGGGGFIKFGGHADTSKRIAQIEESLRDKQHKATGKGMGQETERESLQWAFDETVTIASPLEKAATQTAATKTGAAKAAAPAAKGTETKVNATKSAEEAPASKGGAK